MDTVAMRSDDCEKVLNCVGSLRPRLHYCFSLYFFFWISVGCGWWLVPPLPLSIISCPDIGYSASLNGLAGDSSPKDRWSDECFN